MDIQIYAHLTLEHKYYSLQLPVFGQLVAWKDDTWSCRWKTPAEIRQEEARWDDVVKRALVREVAANYSPATREGFRL